MQKPILIIVAGCNGAGKSTYSQAFVHKSITPYDYDKRLLEVYNSLPDSELREKFAKDQVTEEFKSSINGAFLRRESFCYETNFDSNPIYWANKAKELGYFLELHFYCLDSIEIAKERVDIRTKQNGHFVRDDIVAYKWKEGYKNLNLNYTLFDYILLIDNSVVTNPIQPLFSIENLDSNSIVRKYKEEIPKYAQRRFPDIYQLFQDNFPEK